MQKYFKSIYNKLSNKSPGSPKCPLDFECKFETCSLSSSYEVNMCSIVMTYTQIKSLPDGSALIPSKHGVNRDAVGTEFIANRFGVIAIADGCGLMLWSQIASYLAVQTTMAFAREKMSAIKEIEQLKRFLKEAIQHVNNSLYSYEHPNTEESVNILEKGGNTTLIIVITYPYKTKNGIKRLCSVDRLQKDRGEVKWGALCIGMGDSEVYCFRVHRDSKEDRVEVKEPSLSKEVYQNREVTQNREATQNREDPFHVEKPSPTSDSVLEEDHGIGTTPGETTELTLGDDVENVGSEIFEKPNRISTDTQDNSSNMLQEGHVSSHNLNSSEDESVGNHPMPSHEFKFDSTPNLAYGKWDRIDLKQKKTPFLPYQGLKDKHIPEPVDIHLEAGESILAVTDGIFSSFMENLDLFPSVNADEYRDAKGLSYLCFNLLCAAHDSHIKNHTAPDDVTIGAIKVNSTHHGKERTIKDYTKHFHGEDVCLFYKESYAEKFLQSYSD